MSTYYSPRMVTDGMIVYYDAKNYKSSVTESATWNNLVADNDATFLTNVTWSEDGYYVGTNGDIQTANSQTFQSGSSWTFSQWQKKPVGSSSVWRAFCGANIAGQGGYFYFAPNIRWYMDYQAPTYYGIMATNDPFDWTYTEGVWHNITLAYNGAELSCSLMVNGDEVVQKRAVFWSDRTDTFRPIHIGNMTGGGGTRGFQGWIATHIVWDRELSIEENKQNFDALKSRFE